MRNVFTRIFHYKLDNNRETIFSKLAYYHKVGLFYWGFLFVVISAGYLGFFFTLTSQAYAMANIGRVEQVIQQKQASVESNENSAETRPVQHITIEATGTVEDTVVTDQAVQDQGAGQASPEPSDIHSTLNEVAVQAPESLDSSGQADNSNPVVVENNGDVAAAVVSQGLDDNKNTLVILKTTTLPELAVIREHIENKGGQIQSVFPPSALIGKVPAAVVADLQSLDAVLLIAQEPVNENELADHPESSAKDAALFWNNLFHREEILQTYQPAAAAAESQPVQTGALQNIAGGIKVRRVPGNNPPPPPAPVTVENHYEGCLQVPTDLPTTKEEKISRENHYRQEWNKKKRELNRHEHNKRRHRLQSEGKSEASENYVYEMITGEEPDFDATQESNTSLVAGAPGSGSLGAPPGAGFYDSSLYLAKNVAVGVFFVPGTNGAWTSADIDAYFSFATISMDSLKLFDSKAQVAFTYVKETTTPHPAGGLPCGTNASTFSACRTYVNGLRDANQTDWAFMITVANEPGRGFAYLNGPEFKIFRGTLGTPSTGGSTAGTIWHETMHIFGAMDQYHPDAARSPIDRWGYLNVVNANSQYNNGLGYFSGAGEGLNDIMIATPATESPTSAVLGVYTRGQIGWRDTDGDGIFDPLDTFPDTQILSISGSNPFIITGHTEDKPLPTELPTASFNDVSLNKIQRVEYRFNGVGAWKVLQQSDAVDGAFDSGSEDFSFVLPALSDGTYILAVRAVNSVDNTEKFAARETILVSGSSVTNNSPVASFSVNHSLGSLGTTFIFDASASSDSATSSALLSVRWDFEGDGVWDTPYSTTKTAAYVYSAAGSYNPKLEVIDGGVPALADTAVKKVDVQAAGLYPTALFKAAPSSKHGGGTNFFVDLDANASYDGEDDPAALQVRWDFENNGTWDTNWSTAKSLIHTYPITLPKTNLWRISMQVKDSANNISSALREVWAVPYNNLPVAGTVQVTDDLNRIVQCLGASDPDSATTWDGLLEYRWDFENDGVWDTDYDASYTTATFPIEVLNRQSTVMVCEVKDRFGATAQSTLNYTPPNFPPAMPNIGNQSAYVNELFEILLSATDINNDNLTITATGLPAGSAFVTTINLPGQIQGQFSWLPQMADLGDHAFTVQVSDGNFTVTRNITITVKPPRAKAVFVVKDTTTQGNWKGVYGQDGYRVSGDTTNYPVYAVVNITGTDPTLSPYTWMGSTTDVRALQKAIGTDRIAATDFGWTTFDIDINLVDGAAHRLAIYNLDWDGNNGRIQRVDILDADSNGILDSQNINSFSPGHYLVWDLLGHIKVRVTTSAINAVISGLFFGPGNDIAGQPALFSIGNKTVQANNNLNFTVSASDPQGDPLTYSVSGLPAGASFNSTTRTFSWTPTVGQVGDHTVTFNVSDGTNSNSETITIIVTPIPTSSVSFVALDTTTQGNWKQLYGGDGYDVVNHAVSYPSYATVSVTGSASYTWADPTPEVRALEKIAGTDRIAATWYSGTNFTLDVNMTDGLTHKVGIYMLDWDGNNSRAQRVDVIDFDTGIVMNTQNGSSFRNGKYLVWDIRGHVQIRVTRTAGGNAVVSGLFFGNKFNNPPILDPVGNKSTAVGFNLNFTVTGSDMEGDPLTFSASGLPSGATFNPSTRVFNWAPAIGQQGSYNVTFNVNDGVRNDSETITIAVSPPPTSTVNFLNLDTATQGNWKSLYGGDGYNVVNDTVSYPSYATVNVTGSSTPYTWSGTTSDVRALQRVPPGGNRIAATWYSGTNFIFDVNLTDGLTHKVGIYMLDWDNLGRAQRVEVIDFDTGVIMNTQNISSFSNGQYLNWNIRGHVQIRVTNTGPGNAVVSGLFFGGQFVAPNFPPVLGPIGNRTVNAGSNLNFTLSATDPEGDLLTFGASGLPSGATFNSATMVFNWTPTSGQAGNHNITFNVSDGPNNDSETITVTVNLPPPPTSTVNFLNLDTTTQGNWKSIYGGDGRNVVNDAVSYPGYATVNVTGSSTPYTWAGSTSDVRALQRVLGSNRIAATWYSGTSFIFDVNMTDGLTHKVGIYMLDWDNLGRAQTVEVIDFDTGTVMNTQNVSSFGNGQYLAWNIRGHVQIRVTRTAGMNAVASGLFFGGQYVPPPNQPPVLNPIGNKTVNAGSNLNFTLSATDPEGDPLTFSTSGLPSGATFNPATMVFNWTPTSGQAGNHNITFNVSDGAISDSEAITVTVNSAPPPTSTVNFLNLDTATQGNWKSIYGGDGRNVVNDAVSYPSYATVSVTGSSTPYTWAPSTSDVRALQKVVGADKIAATWYSGASFTYDINLTDGLTHKVGIYMLDWDNLGRAQRVEVIDFDTGTVMHTQNVSSFGNGQYLNWNIRGHVQIRVTRVAGVNAVASGLFFGAGGYGPAATFINEDTATQGNWKSVYGADGYVVIGDSQSLPSYMQLTVTNQTQFVWLTATSDVRALQRAAAGRIAATWYTATNMTLDINLTDNQFHRIAIYNLDWDNLGRQQRIDIYDADTNALLTTRTVSGFNSGKYLSWNVRGHVRVVITQTAGPNAAISGIFVN